MRHGRIIHRMLAALALFGLSLLILSAGRPARGQRIDQSLSGPELVAALQKGGYVIVFRHGATNSEPADAATVDLNDCGTQRNLNDTGRAQALAIGAAFRALAIPVGRVLSGPYCRTYYSGLLAFGHAETSADLVLDMGEMSSGERLRAALLGLLAQPPAAGTNTVLVTHVTNIAAAMGLSPAEGGALVVAPNGANGFAVVAQVDSADWTALAGSAPGTVVP